MEENKQNTLEVEISEQVAKGLYSNIACIVNSPDEFYFDFLQLIPNTPKAVVQSRVIMNPLNAKRLLRLLSAQVEQYEQNFGKIIVPEEMWSKEGRPIDATKIDA